MRWTGPCDRPEAVWRRYGGIRPVVAQRHLDARFPVAKSAHGNALASVRARTGTGALRDQRMDAVADMATLDSGLDLYVADLPVEQLRPGDGIEFTFFWSDSSRWEGRDYRVAIV